MEPSKTSFVDVLPRNPVSEPALAVPVKELFVPFKVPLW